jgi:hypothetical protein
MRPQAMKAPMFGITMFDKKVPNLWTCTRIDVRDAGASVTVAMLPPWHQRVLVEMAVRAHAPLGAAVRDARHRNL